MDLKFSNSKVCRVVFLRGKCFTFSILLVLFISIVTHARPGDFTISSPDGKLRVVVETGDYVSWTLYYENTVMIEKSGVSMTLTDGTVWGKKAKVMSSKSERIDATIKAINYKKNLIHDQYQQLHLLFKGNYGLIFRVFNNGFSWRFFSTRKGVLDIKSEQAEFNFAGDPVVYFPYVNDPHNKDRYETSFENFYQHSPLSSIVKDTIGFAPVLVESAEGRKMVITEADLEDYPGMFLQSNRNRSGLSGVFAPFPIAEKQGGHNDLQSFVTARADDIARTAGTRNFPWRVVVVSNNDKELLDNDLIWSLASPARFSDTDWVRPGKVAWDWWNDWNISHVNFKAGINTETYKYYIDFAAASHIEYILLDEGWADSHDIMKVVPDVDLPAIVNYAKQKNIGVWLWGGWLPLQQKMDEALSHYAAIGIKGFKIDFMDRDDQKMMQFIYKLASSAATHKLMIDFHGACKPTGIQRTFPNVVNFEGVRGLENAKWSAEDMTAYEVTIPFIRMIAGPLDYTPGAMRNATKANFRAIFNNPMSQGTRCHQLAMYVVYEAPFEMLADNPTAYQKEIQSLDLIASIPTTFEETVAIDGKVGEYAVVARRKGESWYVGALTNWNARQISLDLSFLKEGSWSAEITSDGLNAGSDATDYASQIIEVKPNQQLSVQLAAGGGWVARFFKRK